MPSPIDRRTILNAAGVPRLASVAGLSDLHRETYHAALGAALESREGLDQRPRDLPPETLDGALCAALAEHFLRGRCGDRAARYVRAATAHLMRQNAHAAATTLHELALATAPFASGEPRVRLLLAKAAALDPQGRRAEQRAAGDEGVQRPR